MAFKRVVALTSVGVPDLGLSIKGTSHDFVSIEAKQIVSQKRK